jgi:four helix bundle protein
MNAEVFKARTLEFALAVVRLCEALPKSRTGDTIARQLLRCGTSVGANYRAACRAWSRADFIAKLGIVEEECDDYLYWMELLVRTGLVEQRQLEVLILEANEILSMVIASKKTARSHTQKWACQEFCGACQEFCVSVISVHNHAPTINRSPNKSAI